MAGLFEGVPTQAPSGSTSTTETPAWFQNLTYQQMMAAKAVADQPYQSYALPRVAQGTPDQQAAYASIRDNVGAWSPTMAAATIGTNGLTGPTSGFGTASNMITGAGNATAPSVVNDYMNPYNEAVTNRIAQLGARNLNENILPAVGDEFIKAGQFGSSRMGDIASRAIRDTNDSVLGQQSQVLQQGYTGALNAVQTDLSRLLSAGQDLGNLSGAEGVRQLGALNQLAGFGQQTQGLLTQDAAALQGIGNEQQQQQQRELDQSYNNYLEGLQYPQKQLDWFQAQLRGSGQYLPTTTNTSGYSTQFSPSPLSQLASGYFALRGLSGNTTAAGG